MLHQRTQPTSITKVRAHSKIEGNEIVDTLAKVGRFKQHFHHILLYKYTHATPYYLQFFFGKEVWLEHHTKAQSDIFNYTS